MPEQALAYILYAFDEMTICSIRILSQSSGSCEWLNGLTTVLIYLGKIVYGTVQYWHGCKMYNSFPAPRVTLWGSNHGGPRLPDIQSWVGPTVHSDWPARKAGPLIGHTDWIPAFRDIPMPRVPPVPQREERLTGRSHEQVRVVPCRMQGNTKSGTD